MILARVDSISYVGVYRCPYLASFPCDGVFRSCEPSDVEKSGWEDPDDRLNCEYFPMQGHIAHCGTNLRRPLAEKAVDHAS